MGLLSPHLDDAAFADVFAARLSAGVGESDRSAERHLRTCSECRVRYEIFTAWLETVGAEARAEADEAFSAERLANQQAQVLRRIEALEHPAKVIAFPRFTGPVSIQPSGRRWIAAAAAAGLIVGIGLGQVLEFGGAVPIRQPDTFSERQIARGNLPVGDAGRRGVQPASTASDEVFLYDVELASSQARVPESLQYLHAVTPSSRDFDPR